MSFHVPEKYRVLEGAFSSNIEDGNNGLFVIPQGGYYFQCIVSDRMGWEHVSSTLRFKNSGISNNPSWDEMCYIKSLFWDEEDMVIQYHPAKSDYINNHPHVLHLWRPVNVEFPKPDSIMVGIK